MPDALAAVREALAHQDWQAAYAAAVAAAPATAGSPDVEAERSDHLAEAAWWLGRLDESIAARELAHRGFDELGDRRRAGQCAVWLSEAHAMGGRPTIGGAWLRRARRSLDDDPLCVEHGTLLLREAEAAHGAGELDRAAALADRVVELGRSLRSTDLEAEALQTKGRVLIDQGQVAEGMGHLDEAMLFAVEGRLGPYSTGKVYCSLVSACEQLGDIDRAAEWTDATLRWAERHPFAIFPGICRVHRAVVLKQRGALAEAEKEARRASTELVGSHVGNSAAALAEVGDICRRLGDLERAEEAFTRAQELCGSPCGDLALLRLAQGRVDAALAIITGCLQATTAHGLARSRLLPTFVHVAVAAGDLAAAEEALAELVDLAEVFATPLLRATVPSTRGRIQLVADDHEAAVATLQEAVDRWRELDVPYEVATVQTLLGQALRLSGDEAAASAAFASAVERFDQIGAHLAARSVLGDVPRARPGGLTEREVEVLRLVAGGMTNNEIAAALVLSAKTVSRHLSNIFTKIGVSSRSAATAYAFEHELVDPRP